MRPLLMMISAALIGLPLVTSAAQADARAEAFVAQYATEAIMILNDEEIALDAKKQRFREIVMEVTDPRRIAYSVLGLYPNLDRNPFYDSREKLNADIAEFTDVFTEYAIGVYESQLGEYTGEDLLVIGSTDLELRPTSRLESDAIVHSEVSGGSQDGPLPVNWRVIGINGALKVVDVEVFGVWLALNQREEMTAIIRAADGDITAATEALRVEIAKREAELAAATADAAE